MASKLTNLLRRVFLSSLAGVVASNGMSAVTSSLITKLNESEESLEIKFKVKRDLSPKLILKKANNDEWTFMSHRSHRSHQSHRSHYSSQGGGHISHFSHYSSSTGGGSTYPNSGGGSYRSPKSGNSSSNLSLGARNLSTGKSGTDVTELINILIRKGYLTSPYVTGTYTYNEVVKNAVKQFQRNNGLQVDGICGPTTIYYLKNR